MPRPTSPSVLVAAASAEPEKEDTTNGGLHFAMKTRGRLAHEARKIVAEHGMRLRQAQWRRSVGWQGVLIYPTTLGVLATLSPG